MGTTFRYLGVDDDQLLVWDWFDRHWPRPERLLLERGAVLHFHEIAPLAYAHGGQLDQRRSPLVSIIPPRRRRGILWTAGEVHFLATPIRSLPAFDRVRASSARGLPRSTRSSRAIQVDPAPGITTSTVRYEIATSRCTHSRRPSPRCARTRTSLPTTTTTRFWTPCAKGSRSVGSTVKRTCQASDIPAR
jgi:hypothetical protein